MMSEDLAEIIRELRRIADALEQSNDLAQAQFDLYQRAEEDQRRIHAEMLANQTRMADDNATVKDAVVWGHDHEA